MSLEIITSKNRFKEITRYLQKQLSQELHQDIKLSTVQEALSRAMGFHDLHAYQHWIDVAYGDEPAIQWANDDLSKQIQSFRFCLKAAQGANSTAIKIKKILLHLYNNQWQCQLDLSSFDTTHKIHTLNTIALAFRDNRELHTFIEDSQDKYFKPWVIEQLKEEWFNEKYIQKIIDEVTHDFNVPSSLKNRLDSIQEFYTQRFDTFQIVLTQEKISILILDTTAGYSANISFEIQEDRGVCVYYSNIQIEKI